MTNKLINLSDITPPPMVYKKKDCDNCIEMKASNINTSIKTQTNLKEEYIVERKVMDKNVSIPVLNQSVPY